MTTLSRLNTDFIPYPKYTKKQADKAVEIARDALKQIALGKFVSTPGVYFRYNNLIIENFEFYNQEYIELEESDFRATFKSDKESKCEVCAIGALFAGRLTVDNEMTVGEARSTNEFDELVYSGYFDGDNLRLMEAVFEGHFEATVPWYQCICDDKDLNYPEDNTHIYDRLNSHIETLHHKYSDTERLQYILRNVIRNKGVFVLPSRIEK